MGWLHLVLCAVVALLSLIYFYWQKYFMYWEIRGVVHDKPSFLYGNMKGVGKTKAIRQPFRDFYNKYKNAARFGGFYLSMRRAVVLFDLELIKNVLVKDFTNFANRGNFYNEQDDPISAHIFNLDGAKWRAMRTKLTPTFTSGKMRYMFPTVVGEAEKFVQVLKETVNKQEETEKGIELRDLLARFTTDVIGTCAFGLECNSLLEPDTKFRVMGKKAFTQPRHGRLKFAFMQAFPSLARKLHLVNTPSDVSTFFMSVVRDTVEFRENTKTERNDFMDLLIKLKNREKDQNITLNEIAAQSFVFFLAGFETSSSTMGFALHEMAVNQDIQNKARAEVLDVLERHDGQFTYEGMRELKYIAQIFYETLRKHSIAAVIIRKTVSDYLIPNSNQIIEKDTVVVVPVDAIHHDPAVYPNPEEFDPDRFAAAEIEKRHPMAWLPFGEGPRNCIGLRFGEMQSIIGLAILLKNFRFTMNSETKEPIEFSQSSIVLAPKDGILLNVELL